MKVYVDCVGCEQRKLDAHRVVNYFKANGATLVSSPKDCDHAIMVTCAVDSSNELQSLSRLAAISKDLPVGAKLIVGGCLPSISLHQLSKHNVAGTFSPRNMEILDIMFRSAVAMERISRPNRSDFDSNMGDILGGVLSPREEYEAAKRGFKVIIDEGCLLNCAYCVIRKATGKLRSVASEIVLGQIRDGVSRGEKTIMLVGGDTGAYGYDTQSFLYHLLRGICGIPENFMLFIHDFNVNWLIRHATKYLDVFSSVEGERIRGICFPTQSGSDRILALMRRPHTADRAAEALKQVRLSAHRLLLGTHVIVGFPSETEADFALTLDFLEYVGFDFITCFPYSEHALADSAIIPGKINQELVDARLDKMLNVFGDRIKIVR